MATSTTTASVSNRRLSPRVFVVFAIIALAISIPFVQIMQSKSGQIKVSESANLHNLQSSAGFSSWQSFVNSCSTTFNNLAANFNRQPNSPQSSVTSAADPKDKNAKNKVSFSRRASQLLGLSGRSGQIDKQASSSSDDITSLDLASQQLLLSIEKDPGNPSLHNQLGLIYAESGQSERALQNFQRAIELARGQLAVLNLQEKTAMSKNNSVEAANVVLASSKLSIDLAASHSSLARIYDQLGQHDKVVAELDLLNRDIAIGSVLNPITTHHSVRAQASVHRLSSQCLQYLARAEALEQAHRLTEAMQLYKQVLKLDPQAAIAHEKLAMVAEASDNFWLAKQEFEAALSLNPGNVNCNVHLGTTYQSLSEPGKAKAQFLKALTVDPNNVLALFHLANICVSHNQTSEAIHTYQRLITVAPSMASAHNNLGMCYSMAHDYPRAIDEYGRALALSPDLASSHYGLGMALYNVKDYHASISELKRALSINPSYLDAREKIELAYRKVNDPAHSVATN